MNFLKYLKTKMKYLIGVASVAALLSQFLLPASGITAAEPRFNFLTGDLELLRGANVTQGDTVFKNPVSGTPGDEFRGLVYYHNGIVDTTALNTRIKVSIPPSTTNKTAKITATISADNAETVSSTVVDGQIVGLDGLVVHLDQDSALEFVPGSVKWFPNSSSNNPNVVPTPLPAGQTGNEIVGANGVNIGDIQGCWEFAGFVSFGFKTIKKVNPAITIDKTVKNITRGEAEYRKNTEAVIGDEVSFNVLVKNTGEIDLDDALLRDEMPNGLIFVPGSFAKIVGGVPHPLSDSDAAKFFNGGLPLEKIVHEGANTAEFVFKATATNFLKSGQVAKNIAIVTAAGKSAESSATVTIVAANIVKNKSAYNDTKKEVASEVRVGDLITYTLTAKNTGNASIDFVIDDNIADVLKSAEVVSISDSGKVTDGVIRWSGVKINAGNSVSKTFQVKVKGNTAGVCFRNVYGNEVLICVEKPVVKPVLHIEKFVRDVTTNETNFIKANQAFAGDMLEYQINFTNTGEGPADQVKFSDTLPSNVQYVAGTTRISRNGCAEQTLSDGIVGNGVTIDSIAPGESGYIRFRATISNGVAKDECLVNTAHLTHKSVTISDTAKTTIIVKSVAPATQLPKTGSTSAGSFLITLMVGIGILYFKYRKLLNLEEAMIINQLVS